MGDYVDEHGIGRSFTPEQLTRVAAERTCERCGLESIHVRGRYVGGEYPRAPDRYCGRFCGPCWRRKFQKGL